MFVGCCLVMQKRKKLFFAKATISHIIKVQQLLLLIYSYSKYKGLCKFTQYARESNDLQIFKLNSVVVAYSLKHRRKLSMTFCTFRSWVMNEYVTPITLAACLFESTTKSVCFLLLIEYLIIPIRCYAATHKSFYNQSWILISK